MKSKCCKAEIETGGRPDFIGSDHVCTVYNQCSKCKEPCEVDVPKKETKRVLRWIKRSIGDVIKKLSRE